LEIYGNLNSLSDASQNVHFPFISKLPPSHSNRLRVDGHAACMRHVQKFGNTKIFLEMAMSVAILGFDTWLQNWVWVKNYSSVWWAEISGRLVNIQVRSVGYSTQLGAFQMWILC